MKVLQVCPKYYPSIGGVEEHVRNISERLAREFDVSILTTDPSGKLPKSENVGGVEVLRFKSWAPNDSYYFSPELRKYLADYSGRYDVVHAHSYHALPALYAAQSKRNNKMVFTSHYHGSGHSWFRKLLHVPYKFFGNGILRKADRVICVSKYEKNLLCSRFNVDENRVSVIPNGVSLEEFRFSKKRDKENRMILYVGRLEKYKGIHYLIKVLRKMDHDVILEIVGKGPYKKKLVALAKKQGVTNRVKFYEDLSRQDLLRKYASADLFVLLSEYEAYSISVAEALASRTPCIVANKSSLTEWVDDKNCFGFDYPIDIAGLARLTCAVIGKEVAAVTLSDWNDVSRKVAEVYRACQK